MCIAGVGFRPEKKFYIKVAFGFLKKLATGGHLVL